MQVIGERMEVAALTLAKRRDLVAADVQGDADAVLRAAGLDDRAIAHLHEEAASALRRPDIPGYRIDALLGIGAHSVVWQAWHGVTGRAVALKVVTAVQARDVETFCGNPGLRAPPAAPSWSPATRPAATMICCTSPAI